MSASSPSLITLTRDRRGNAAWRPALERAGHAVYELPCIQVAAAEITPKLTNALENLAGYHWVVFTSANGVRYFRELATTLGLDLKPLTRARIAAVGPATAAAVKQLGLGVSLAPSRPDAATLARELPRVKHRSILLLRADIAPAGPAEVLRGRLADVTDLPVYGTVPVTDPDPAYEPLLTYGNVAAHVFASPSAVDGLTRRLSEPALARARSLPAIAVGPTTAAALQAAGFNDARLAAEPTAAGIINLIT